MSRKVIGVKVKNIVTKEITTFDDIKDCSDYFEISQSRIRQLLKEKTRDEAWRGCFLFKNINDQSHWQPAIFAKYTDNLTKSRKEHERIWALILATNPQFGQVYY